MDCPELSALHDFVQGFLPPQAREGVRAHLAQCAACCQLVAQGRSSSGGEVTEPGAGFTPGTEPVPIAPPLHALAPGERVGRYVLEEKLGEGAMGVVYAARDPELDRRVALKMVAAKGRAGEEDLGARTRLVNEAQALARLSHPNVVAVHELGLHEDQAYIAMDVVDGETVADWLARGARGWQEVLDVFVAAGRGLAAAHQNGLIHRDFKPANVLIGKDGGVKVSDFGLARVAGKGGHTLESGEALVAPRERSTALCGTPAYMAPEQMVGELVGPGADQFSFCVALYEALYGLRPFAVGMPLEVVLPPPRPERPAAPGWLRRALLRGLALRPAERFPSMDALLAALTRGPVLRARLRLVAALAAPLCALSVLGAAHWRERHAPLCEQAGAAWVGIWDGPARAALRTAFLGTGKPYAAQSYEHVRRVLDGYTAEWTRIQTDACAATRIHGTQSDAQLSLRAACLDRRFKDVRELTALLAQGGAQVVERSAAATAALEGLSECESLSALTAQAALPAAPPARQAVLDAQEHLRRGGMLQETGRYAEALAEADRALAALAAHPHAPTAAGTLLLKGRAQKELGRMEASDKSFEEALVFADEGRDDALRLRAALKLAEAKGLRQDKDEEGLALMKQARAMRARLGADAPPELAIEVESLEGRLAAHRRDFVETQLRYERARELLKTLTRPNPALEALVFERYGRFLAQTGRFSKALAVLEDGLAALERSLGPAHPAAVQLHRSLGQTSIDVGRLDDADRHLRWALSAANANGGPDSPLSVQLRGKVALLRRQQGLAEDSRNLMEATALATARLYGADDAEVGWNRLELGLAYMDLQRPEDARRAYSETVRIGQLSKRPRLAAMGAALDADALLALGKLPAARKRFAAAWEQVRREYKEKEPQRGYALETLSRLELAAGRPAAALAAAQEALEIAQAQPEVLRVDLASALIAVANAERALSHAERSRELLAKVEGLLAEGLVLPASDARRLRALKARCA